MINCKFDHTAAEHRTGIIDLAEAYFRINRLGRPDTHHLSFPPRSQERLSKA